MSIRVSVITSVFRGKDYLTQFFENVRSQTYFDDMEIVLIHNEPPQRELQSVNEFKDQCPDHIQHIVIDKVEQIGASWNRGCKKARGEFLAIWNVNDRRTDLSIESQVEALDNSPFAVMSYGDYYRVPQYGSTEGVLVSTPEFSLTLFRRSFPQGGAFYMWRKEIINVVGGFDEQLIALDYDFSLRIAINGFHMVRTNTLLGYFTNSVDGLSTRSGGEQAIKENNMLFYRYAIYDKIRIKYYPQIFAFEIDRLLVSGEWVPIGDLWSNYKKYRRQRIFLWLLFPIRDILRAVFRALGILPAIYQFQKKVMKKEI
ncbi:MAG: glycosyltransferase [Chloroflexi bacterium]|nr:glycosyltransferase [Chloroflexota bacterium]